MQQNFDGRKDISKDGVGDAGKYKVIGK